VKSLSVSGIENGACRLLDATGHHVGNLKWIRGVWKFKAIGYDASGAVIPGGGALTNRHNTVFASLDLEQINRVLGSAVNAQPTHHHRVVVLGE
jgi:hypothetical protein